MNCGLARRKWHLEMYPFVPHLDSLLKLGAWKRQKQFASRKAGGRFVLSHGSGMRFASDGLSSRLLDTRPGWHPAVLRPPGASELEVCRRLRGRAAGRRRMDPSTPDSSWRSRGCFPQHSDRILGSGHILGVLGKVLWSWLWKDLIVFIYQQEARTCFLNFGGSAANQSAFAGEGV